MILARFLILETYQQVNDFGYLLSRGDILPQCTHLVRGCLYFHCLLILSMTAIKLKNHSNHDDIIIHIVNLS